MSNEQSVIDTNFLLASIDRQISMLRGVQASLATEAALLRGRASRWYRRDATRHALIVKAKQLEGDHGFISLRLADAEKHRARLVEAERARNLVAPGHKLVPTGLDYTRATAHAAVDQVVEYGVESSFVQAGHRAIANEETEAQALAPESIRKVPRW